MGESGIQHSQLDELPCRDETSAGRSRCDGAEPKSRQRVECVCFSTALAASATGYSHPKAAMNRAHSRRFATSPPADKGARVEWTARLVNRVWPDVPNSETVTTPTRPVVDAAECFRLVKP